MSAILSTIVHPEEKAANVAGLRALKSSLRAIARYFDYRAAIRTLHELDDEALKDIGLGRSEIVPAVYGLEGAPKRVKIS